MNTLDHATRQLLESLGVDMRGKNEESTPQEVQISSLKRAWKALQQRSVFVGICATGALLSFIIPACSTVDSTGVQEKRKYDTDVFSDCPNMLLLDRGVKRLAWTERALIAEAEESAPENVDIALLSAMSLRKTMLRERGEVVTSAVKAVAQGFYMDQLFVLNTGTRKLIQADLTTGEMISNIVLNEGHPVAESRKILEEIGVTEEGARQYQEILRDSRNVSSMVDQAIEILTDGGADLAFTAETLCTALDALDDIEFSQNSRKNMLLAELLPVPQMRDKLYEAATAAVDLAISQKCLEVEPPADEHYEQSLQEIKAIALLLHRLPRKGDTTRLYALESLYEKMLCQRRIEGPVSLLVESTNSLRAPEWGCREGILVESVIYPPERYVRRP